MSCLLVNNQFMESDFFTTTEPTFSIRFSIYFNPKNLRIFVLIFAQKCPTSTLRFYLFHNHGKIHYYMIIFLLDTTKCVILFFYYSEQKKLFIA